jgi:hypothetical protein
LFHAKTQSRKEDLFGAKRLSASEWRLRRREATFAALRLGVKRYSGQASLSDENDLNHLGALGGSDLADTRNTGDCPQASWRPWRFNPAAPLAATPLSQ